MNDRQIINIREQALTALLMINEEGRLSNAVINEALDKYGHIDLRDRALFVRLIHGSLEYRLQSDYIIDIFSKIKVKKMKPLVRETLRMSVYQIMHMDKIPDNAVCDEAVKLIKKTKYRDLSGFVNGLLRNIIRHRDEIKLSNSEVLYSTPAWMISLIEETVGHDNAKRFLEYSLDYHGVSVRIAGTDDIELIKNAGSLEQLPEWNSGKLIVQDYSSAQPIINSGIKSRDRVLDVCAAPGGKSIQAAEKAAEVISCDISLQKTDIIRENIKKYNLNNVIVKERDASVHYPEFDEYADILIADLPCSGIGTIGRKPDVKNRLSFDDCIALSGIQKVILDNVSNYVKHGGLMIYSTCTIDHYENEDVIRHFLDHHKDFSLISENILLPDDIPKDGFFYAYLRRK